MSENQVQFTVYQPNLTASRLAIEGPVITLGRAVDCTIPIKDRFLSRKHAEITLQDGRWYVRDCGSVNGTLLNGVKLTEPALLHPGDRITLGDSQVIFEPEPDTTRSQFVALDSISQAKNLAVPLQNAIDEIDRGRDRVAMLASLAAQFLEDRSMDELFDFILSKVSELLQPSRVALALLGPDGQTFESVHVRRQDADDNSDLAISRTLLGEVIQGRNVVSFIDASADDKLALAESLIGQQIRSAVCAPLVVGDVVFGVLYLDFLAQRGAVTHEDVRLIAQVARFAAVKLETTRLRDEAIAKAKFDEELRTAYTIQSRLLPASLPIVEGYEFAAANKPCKTVSGDYYDIVVRPSGKIYFVIADVSGKGITAALVMSSLATAFSIFTRTDPSPADLVRELNVTLAPKLSPTKFATLFAAVLDPATGRVEFANAGHVPPLVIGRDGVQQLKTTDMVVGLFPAAQYRNQSITLEAGDSLVLFTDGVTEAENEAEEQLGLEPVALLLDRLHGTSAPMLLTTIDQAVQTYIGTVPHGDDVTMLALSRAVAAVAEVTTRTEKLAAVTDAG